MSKLTVWIGANVNGLMGGIDKAKKKADAFANGLKSSFTSAMGALGVGVSAAGLAIGAKKIIDDLDGVAKAAKRVGVSAEDWQKLTYAAKLSGSTAEDVEASFKRMAKVIENAKAGSQTDQDALGGLGLRVGDLAGKDSIDQFRAIADALVSITDKTELAARAQEIFGRSGTMLIPMLADYRTLGDELERIGGVVSGDSISAAENFNDALERLSTAIKGIVADSGFVGWLADVAAGIQAVAQNKKDMERLKAEGEYKKKSGVAHEVVDAAAQGKTHISMAAGWLFGDKTERAAEAVTRWTPLGLAARGIKKTGLMGTSDSKPAIVSPAITKDEVIAANAAREEEKKRKAEAERVKRETAQRKERDAAEKLAARAREDEKRKADAEAERGERNEDMARGGFRDALVQLEEKRKLLLLINDGKEREARIQEEINAAEKEAARYGQSLNDGQREALAAAAGKLWDAENANKPMVEQDVFRGSEIPARDILARVGGSLGDGGGIASSQLESARRQTALISKIEQKLNNIDTKITPNNNAGVFP